MITQSARRSIRSGRVQRSSLVSVAVFHKKKIACTHLAVPSVRFKVVGYIMFIVSTWQKFPFPQIGSGAMQPWKIFEIGKLRRAITSDLRENNKFNIHA